MPQIWPMNWLILFVFFTMALMVMLSLIYFFNPLGKQLTQEKPVSFLSTNLDWKW